MSLSSFFLLLLSCLCCGRADPVEGALAGVLSPTALGHCVLSLPLLVLFFFSQCCWVWLLSGVFLSFLSFALG